MNTADDPPGGPLDQQSYPRRFPDVRDWMAGPLAFLLTMALALPVLGVTAWLSR